MDEVKHIKELANLCRVCGGPVKQNRLCRDHEAALKSVFSIDISTDRANVHPQKFCKRCYAVVSRSRKAEAEGRVYLHAVEPAEWCVRACWGGLYGVWEHQLKAKRRQTPKRKEKERETIVGWYTHTSHGGTETSTP